MAKRKLYLPDKYSSAGYSDWSIRRTLAEAENVSRWNPWLAHAWMEEARNQISLDNPFFKEFDTAATRINEYWESLPRYRWFNQDDFWEKDGISYHPTPIELISE